jgi:hypothetical protein
MEAGVKRVKHPVTYKGMKRFVAEFETNLCDISEKRSAGIWLMSQHHSRITRLKPHSFTVNVS